MHKAAETTLTLVNGTLANGESVCVRIERGRIASMHERPEKGDVTIDLRGHRVLPGLINAHDHLQLNGLPHLKYRDEYRNATQWIDDIRPRLEADPFLLAHRAVPREERLLIGGLKNLMSGVTTVAHHDSLYPALLEETFPVRVVTQYGWAHSLALDGEEAVLRSFRQTPQNRPWIIHAAEGIDEVARSEVERLHFMGCITSNTVLVHGTALEARQHRRLAAAGAGLVWCPASNLQLFGKTVDVAALNERGHVALGTDSRLSGSRDLLAELRLARESASLGEAELEEMVTRRACRLLRLADRGELRVGALADIVALPADVPLSRAERADIQLVLVGGEAGYSDPGFAFAFGESSHAKVQVDGRTKCLGAALVTRLRRSLLQEPGLTFCDDVKPAATHSRRAAV